MSDVYKYKEGLVCLVPKEGRGGLTSHEKTLCDCHVLEIFAEIEKLKAIKIPGRLEIQLKELKEENQRLKAENAELKNKILAYDDHIYSLERSIAHFENVMERSKAAEMGEGNRYRLLMNDNAKLTKQNEIMKKALDFYADENSWGLNSNTGNFTLIGGDIKIINTGKHVGGRCAREALRESEGVK